MRLSLIMRNVPSGMTLTTRLTQLAECVEEYISGKNNKLNTSHNTMKNMKNTSISSNSISNSNDTIWEQVISTVQCANALKETDTLLAIVFRLLNSGLHPPLHSLSSNNNNNNNSIWPILIRDLTPYSDIEANAVLSYPGIPEDNHNNKNNNKRNIQRNPIMYENNITNFSTSSIMTDELPLLQPTRETLLMTGGIVPLSARIPCSDGKALAKLIDSFCNIYENQSHSNINNISNIFLQEITIAIVSSLQKIASTVMITNSSPITLAIIRFFHLLFQFSTQNKKKQSENKSLHHLIENFAKRLTKVLSYNGLAARILLLFISQYHEKFPDKMLHLPLVRIAIKSLWRHYKILDSLKCLHELQQVNEAVDVTLQRNANNGNPLGMNENDESDIRLLLSLALLRAMRLQAISPDIFLRDAVDIIDRCPMSLSLEYELLVAKVQLLELFLDDDESREAIYDDLLQSLRALVELRPRDNSIESLSDSNTKVMGNTSISSLSINNNNKEEEEEEEEEKEEKSLLQNFFQEAHRIVVTAFAQSHIEERLNQAYTILVTHKYHGLIITKEVMHPLLDALSRRGDCRVFNIVDLCVLYSGRSIDYETLTYLFKACRVAGDFYRARTLYQLLREMIPGFLLRAPPEIISALRELKVMEPEPSHIFNSVLTMNKGENNINNNDDSIVENTANAVVCEGVLDDESLMSIRRGPIRELPNMKGDSQSKGTANASH